MDIFGQRALPPVIVENRSTHHKKCWKHICRAHEAFQKERLKYARRRYLAAREAYLKLEYYEKKELYPHLEELHNALQHGQHPPV